MASTSCFLTDAVAIGNGAARTISYFPRDPGNLTYKDSDAWVTAYANKDTTFTRNGAYRLDPRVLFHFGYICVSPAMAMTVAGKGSDYSTGMLDSEGKVLDGSGAPGWAHSAEPASEGFLGDHHV